MKIGIIGAGYIGKAIATQLAPKGYEIMMANSRGVEAVREVAEAHGCIPGTAEDAAQFGDVVVVTVPLGRFDALPFAAIGQRIVIDTCNYYPNRDGKYAEFESGPETTSGYLQKKMPNAKLVKAFNSILWRVLHEGGGKPANGGQHALPIASDDESAAEVVADIVRDCGLDPVFAGPLAESWKFERARPVYCRIINAGDLRDGLAKTTKDDWVPENSWKLI